MSFSDTYGKAETAVKQLKLFVFSDDKEHLLKYLRAVLDAGISLESSLAHAQSEVKSLRAKLGHAKKFARSAQEDIDDGDMPSASSSANLALDSIEAADEDAGDIEHSLDRAESVATELKKSAAR